jgi:L-lactate dehydrogenase complex protein LldE
MLIHHAPAILAKESTAGARATEVAARTYELTQFLVDVAERTDCGGCLRATATYHPSCHGLRGLGIEHQPQALLEKVDALELRPLGEAQTCCGFGGLFAVKMDVISAAMLDRKIDAIEATGADLVVGTDVSCLMHIGGGLHRRGSRVGTRHIAEVLASAPAPASVAPQTTPTVPPSHRPTVSSRERIVEEG